MKKIIMALTLVMLILGGQGISISADEPMCKCGCGLLQEKCDLEGCPKLAPGISV
jgi:hypothetical protein